MYDTAIVGAGIFGSVIAKALRSIGRRVIIIDAELENAGSYPAACLMKSGWFSSLGKGVYTPALEALDKLYGLKEVEFKVGLTKATVFWIPPKEILSQDFKSAKVSRIQDSTDKFLVWMQDVADPIEARQVVVAAGIWTELLIPQVKQRGISGMAFLWPDQDIDLPFVSVWAPYKQVVAFNRGDGLWVGDGSAILAKNWNDQYAQKSLDRCQKAVGIAAEPRKLFGIRPYYEAKPCLLQEWRPGLWVASGGAKNGTLAAGWCASELMKAMS